MSHLLFYLYKKGTGHHYMIRLFNIAYIKDIDDEKRELP